MDCETDRMMLKISAVTKPSTLKPVTKCEQSKIIAALITKRKSPSDITVIGKVKKTRIGFTIAFSKPKTIATIIEV